MVIIFLQTANYIMHTECLQLKPRIGLDTANPYMNKGY